MGAWGRAGQALSWLIVAATSSWCVVLRLPAFPQLLFTAPGASFPPTPVCPAGLLLALPLQEVPGEHRGGEAHAQDRQGEWPVVQPCRSVRRSLHCCQVPAPAPPLIKRLLSLTLAPPRPPARHPCENRGTIARYLACWVASAPALVPPASPRVPRRSTTLQAPRMAPTHSVATSAPPCRSYRRRWVHADANMCGQPAVEAA